MLNIKKSFLHLSFLSSICLMLISSQIVAQTDLRTSLEQHQLPLSVFDKNNEDFSFNLTEQSRKQLRENPAVPIWLNKQVNIKNGNTPLDKFNQSIVLSRVASAKRDGDYLPHEGNAFTDLQLVAGGEIYNKSIGSLFGMGQYARGTHKDIAWNSTRHAELYLPYILADSTGGNYSFENYFLKGGYSFMLSENISLGVLGSYRGEFAYRVTDPRATNTTSWLNLRVGAGIKLNKYLLSMHAGYLYNKQYINLRNWRPGEQSKFFVPYGFGQIDVTNTPIGFGISRMHYLNGWELSADFQPNKKREGELSIAGGISAHGEHLKVEESSVKNLFETNTTTFKPWALLQIPIGNSSNLDIHYSGSYSFRNGLENIYESYKTADTGVYIYDHRIVDVRDRYHFMMVKNNFKLKYNHKINSEYGANIMLGVMNTYRKETYDNPEYLIENLNIMPMAGLGFTFQNKKHEAGLEGIFNIEKPLRRNYDLEPEGDMADFQHAFLPYAFYTREGYTLRANLYYAYKINDKHKIGINVQAGYTKSSRPMDVRYNRIPSFQSGRASTPKTDADIINNLDKWGNITLFFIF